MELPKLVIPDCHMITDELDDKVWNFKRHRVLGFTRKSEKLESRKPDRNFLSRLALASSHKTADNARLAYLFTLVWSEVGCSSFSRLHRLSSQISNQSTFKVFSVHFSVFQNLTKQVNFHLRREFFPLFDPISRTSQTGLTNRLTRTLRRGVY